jgi:hypothetical protein
MKVRLINLLILLFFSGCAGYHFSTNNNPLISYDIKSIAVPMFINRSVFSQAGANMTKEVISVLNDYPGLRVYSGNNDDADAVLIGIVESAEHTKDALVTTQTLFTDETLKNSVGARPGFYYPIQSKFDFKVRFILIKRPSKDELELFSGDLGKMIKVHPKIVLQDKIDVTGSFSRAAASSSDAGRPSDVNFTKNLGIFEKSLQDACYQAAQNFKQVVLNAF